MLNEVRHPAVLTTAAIVGVFCVLDFFTRVLPYDGTSQQPWEVPEYQLNKASNVIATLPESLNQWIAKSDAKQKAAEQAAQQAKNAEKDKQPKGPQDLPGGTKVDNLSVIAKATFQSEDERLGLFQIMERESGESYLRLLRVGDSVGTYAIQRIERNLATLSREEAQGAESLIELDVFSPESYSAPTPTGATKLREFASNRNDGASGSTSEQNKATAESTKRAVLTEEERAEFEALLNAPRHSEKDSKLEEGNND